MTEEQAHLSTTAAAPDEVWPDKAARDVEFSFFYEEDSPRLVGFLIVQGARPVVAADIAQDTMTEAYRKWDSIDSPRAWVRTVATRRWWRWQELDQRERNQELQAHVLLSEAASDEVEARHTLIAALCRLPPKQRQVMAWTYDGYLPNEIAAILGAKPATIRATLRDAREALRRELGPSLGTA